MLIKSVKRIYSGCSFLYRNILGSIALNSFSTVQDDQKDIIYRGYNISDESQISKLLLELSGFGFSLEQRWLYRIVGEKMLRVAVSIDDERIVGVEMFYFNKRDIIDGTIHEGFIGVLPDMNNRGIATTMRKISLDDFSHMKLRGVSSRISDDNLASVRSAKKLGFRIIEEYFDSYVNANRYYLIYNLDEKVFFNDNK